MALDESLWVPAGPQTAPTKVCPQQGRRLRAGPCSRTRPGPASMQQFRPASPRGFRSRILTVSDRGRRKPILFVSGRSFAFPGLSRLK